MHYLSHGEAHDNIHGQYKGYVFAKNMIIQVYPFNISWFSRKRDLLSKYLRGFKYCIQIWSQNLIKRHNLDVDEYNNIKDVENKVWIFAMDKTG